MLDQRLRARAHVRTPPKDGSSCAATPN
jgi:hypothetical protein